MSCILNKIAEGLWYLREPKAGFVVYLVSKLFDAWKI